jgi:hypothetical protein
MGDLMEYRELQRYALTGLLVRISAEEKRLPIIKDPQDKKRVETNIATMKRQYNELLEDLRKE